jgi:hypothetical protein
MSRNSQDYRSATVSLQESEPKEPTMEAAQDALEGNGSAVLPASSLECPPELPANRAARMGPDRGRTHRPRGFK